MWKKLDNEFISPLINTEYKEAYNMPRQKLPEVYWQTGHIDVIKADTILNKNSISGKNILPIFIDNAYCVDIDRIEDLKMAEILLDSELIDIDHPVSVFF